MINISEALGTLAQRITSREPLSRMQLLSELEVENPQIISLLLLIHNHAIGELSMSEHLLFLEQITIVVSTLVRFDSLQASLAKFDRADFKRQCKTRPGKQSSLLASSVDGIYPQRDINQLPYRQSAILAYDRSHLIDDSIVGNHNWQATRSVLHHFYQHNANQQERIYLQILLCYQEQLVRSYRSKEPFYRLWVILYTLTLQIFHEERVITERQITRLQLQVNNLRSDVTSNKEQIVLLLVDYCIRRVLLERENSSKLMHISECCLKQLIDSKNLQNAMIFLQLEDCLNLSFGEEQSQKQQMNQTLRRRIQDIKDAIQKDSTVQNRYDIISYLLPKDQLFNYFLTHSGSFWNYPLLPSQRQSLAQTYLRSTDQILPQQTFEQLIRHSSLEFKQALFEQPQLWLNELWAESFIALCFDPPSDLVEILSKLAQQEDANKIKQGLCEYSKQWSGYLSLREEQSAVSKQNLLRDMVCYSPLKPNNKFRKVCKFPQDYNRHFAFLCLQHLKDTGQFQSSHLYTLFESNFMENVMNAAQGGEDMDRYWEAAIDIFLNSDQVIRGLLQIEPADNIQTRSADNKLIQHQQHKQASSVNDL